MRVAEPIEWTSEGVVMIDQRRLPGELVHHTYTDYRDVAKRHPRHGHSRRAGHRRRGGHGRGAGRAALPGALRWTELRAEFPAICDTIRADAAHGRRPVLGH